MGNASTSRREIVGTSGSLKSSEVQGGPVPAIVVSSEPSLLVLQTSYPLHSGHLAQLTLPQRTFLGEIIRSWRSDGICLSVLQFGD